MKSWERLCRNEGISKRQARRRAHAIADNANSIGMFTSDSLQLGISAVEANNAGSTRDDWYASLVGGHVINQANGIRLDWMPQQFAENEIAMIGLLGIQSVGNTGQGWESDSMPQSVVRMETPVPEAEDTTPDSRLERLMGTTQSDSSALLTDITRMPARQGLGAVFGTEPPGVTTGTSASPTLSPVLVWVPHDRYADAVALPATYMRELATRRTDAFEFRIVWGDDGDDELPSQLRLPSTSPWILKTLNEDLGDIIYGLVHYTPASTGRTWRNGIGKLESRGHDPVGGWLDCPLCGAAPTAKTDQALSCASCMRVFSDTETAPTTSEDPDAFRGLDGARPSATLLVEYEEGRGNRARVWIARPAESVGSRTPDFVHDYVTELAASRLAAAQD